MISLWNRTPVMRRIALGLLVVSILLLIGSWIWHYSSWPSTILVVIAVILNNVRRMGPGRNPQENDPNRR